MNLRKKIKAGGIASLTDARYFSAMMVDYLGMPLSGARALGPEIFSGIAEWVPGPTIVGELGDMDLDTYRWLDAQLSLSAIETSNTAFLDRAEDLPEPSFFVADAQMATGNNIKINHWLDKGHFLIIHSEEGFDFDEFVSGFSRHVDRIIAEVPPADEHTWRTIAKAGGFSIRSEEAEEKTGFKDFEEMDRFFEWYRINFEAMP